MTSQTEYFAVTASQLRAALGSQCSPNPNGLGGYVMGPDLKGRMCHVATCATLSEARKVAAVSNNNN